MCVCFYFTGGQFQLFSKFLNNRQNHLIFNLTSISSDECFTDALLVNRLALKAFTDQKRRFFPHLEDENASNNEPALKKPCFSHGVTDVKQNELIDSRSLSDILSCMEKEVPELKIFTYERLDWLKQASALPSQANENSIGALKEHSYHSPRMSPGALGATPADKAGVIELIIPSVFRAVVSLHPVGSVEPDALAFFSPDEVLYFPHKYSFSKYFTHYSVVQTRKFSNKWCYCLI